MKLHLVSKVGIVLFIIIVLGFLFYQNQRIDDSKVKFLTSRNFSGKVLKVREFPLETRVSRFNVEGDWIYMVDYINQSIAGLKDGKEMFSVGSKGEGPKENLSIGFFDVDLSDSVISIIDIGQNAIKQITFNKSLQNYYKTDYLISRGVKIDDSNFLISTTQSDLQQLKFVIININNGEKKELTKVNELFKEEYSGLLYDGFLIRANDKNYYVCYQSNLFICFNDNGDLIFKSKTIIEPRSAEIIKRGAFIIPHGVITVLDIDVDDQYLYVLSSVKEAKEGDFLSIDCYNSQNGKYHKSILVPIREGYDFPRNIRVVRNSVYVQYENNMVLYELIQ